MRGQVAVVTQNGMRVGRCYPKQVVIKARQLLTQDEELFPCVWVKHGCLQAGVDKKLSIDVGVTVVIHTVQVAVKVFTYHKFITGCVNGCWKIKHFVLVIFFS